MLTGLLSSKDLQQVLDFTVSLAREAGLLITQGSVALLSSSSSTSEVKKNTVDLVTEYDVRVETLVESKLKEHFPSFNFIGEESYAAGRRPPLTDAPTFCVDPIDGTTNFIHGFPFVCISLGLIYKQRPVMGVIFNPFLDHMYTALEGQGSFLSRASSTPVRLPIGTPRPLKTLGEALIGVEWGSARDAISMNAKGGSYISLAGDPSAGVVNGQMVHSLRSLGTSALDFAMVAQGAFDIYWEIGPWPWDVCAGIIIAQEAGCLVVGGAASLSSSTLTSFEVTPEILTGRKYLAIRAMEGGVKEQARIAKEFYGAVKDVEADKDA